MPDDNRDGNDVQRDRAESRLRAMVRDEIGAVLEPTGIDTRTPEGRRTFRSQLDYLGRLYENQDSNRAGLDFAREMLLVKEKVLAALRWVEGKMTAETQTRDAVRKTVVDKISGAVVWVLVAGMGAGIAYLAAIKGHLP